jgi:TRAP-type C4-dicarboxylate transport system permease small subunit
MLTLLERVESGLNWLAGGVAIFFMIVAFLFTLGQAADRYIYDTSFNAHDQITQLALIWLTFIGFALALRAGTNIRVDLIDGFLAPHWVWFRNFLGDVLALVLFVVIQVKIWRLVEVGSGQVIMGTPFSSDVTFLALAVGSAYGIAVLSLRLVVAVFRKSSARC